MIYFIQNQATGSIKIGFSNTPKKRLKTLQTASPDQLNLLGTVPGGEPEEAEIHQRLAAHRLKGEWFRPVFPVTREVDRLLSGRSPKALPSSSGKKHCLVGLWFHSRNEDREIEWQGQVLRVQDGIALVQLYEWLVGQPGRKELVPIDSMRGWSFYADDREMRVAYGRENREPEHEIEANERSIELINRMLSRG